MIFVTVGSHTLGFDRLIKHIDAIVPKLNEPVIMQTGSTKYTPVNAEFFDFKSSIDTYIEQSSLVICHGSMIILEVLNKKKPVIAVPRQGILNEHINDHQINFCKKVAAGVPLKYYTDVTLLTPEIINNYRDLLPYKNKNLEKLKSFIKEKIDELL